MVFFARLRSLFWLLAVGLAVTAAFRAHAEPAVPEPDLARMAGEMILVGFRGAALADDAPVLRALAEGKAGGVILFSRDGMDGGPRNIESPTQLRALTARIRRAAPGPIFVAVDQEGGKVQRLSSRNGFPDWPSARALGRGDAQATYLNALNMGGVLAQAGFNLNFAPVVDLDYPDSPAIGNVERAFHRRPDGVTAHARAFVQGLEEAGVVPVLKHFPGHGSARGDTHDGFVDVSATWTPDELEPYRVLLDEGFDGMIMVAHVALRQYGGNVPADLSPGVIDGLLRGKLGWDGVVVTDDLQMGAVTGAYSLEDTVLLAVNAGADILLFGNNLPLAYDELVAEHAHGALMRLVREGRIDPARIRASWRRIQAIKQHLS